MAKLKKLKQKNKKVKTKKPKNQFDFESFKKSFTSLDPQNMGSWPIVVKLTIALFIMALIGLLAYMVPIKNKMNEIVAAEKEKQGLLEQYKEKETKARNLQAYKQQIEQMKSTFTQLLDQLPKDTRIPDLIEDINMRGVGSGITFKDISVRDELKKELFIEQPIDIKSKGDYHEFGGFVSGLANLSRIMTLHDFDINNTVNSTDILNQEPKLEFQLLANTYRAKSDAEESKK